MLVDIDGVVRTWSHTGARLGEERARLPAGTLIRLAYRTAERELAHLGVITHDEWIESIRERLKSEYGAESVVAVDSWAEDRGTIDHAVVDLLRRARTVVPVAALTNNTTAVLDDLALDGVLSLFDFVLCSAEIHVAKPSPLAYTKAAEKLGIPPRNVFFVDDLASNVQGAAFAGMHAVVFSGSNELVAQLRTAGIRLPAQEDPPVRATSS
ncbi:HAD-IA family hydrolase [Lentzea sp. NPDC051208]|uniref:HAD-IA family hydrolase n=1 Tax=Lentzea sp. NPDC051208 TaxID=3154642 RepID=UPI003428156C